jgi:60 kDa SS-A/Ro ribonucleoprotein
VSPRRRMDDNLRVARSMPFSGTDCALPITDALRKRQEVDTFIVYTDSETWAGPVTVTDALARYRREINPKARMVVVGMASTGFTIADPNDAGSLDVVGFDTAAPQVISEFAQR